MNWSLPLPKGGYRKRPFATTTVASSDLLELLAEGGKTWAEVAAEVNYDPEAKAVATRFVAEGFGDVPAESMMGRGRA